MDSPDRSGLGIVIAVIGLPILVLAVVGLIVFDVDVHMGLVAFAGGVLAAIVGLAMVVGGVGVEIVAWRRSAGHSAPSDDERI